MENEKEFERLINQAVDESLPKAKDIIMRLLQSDPERVPLVLQRLCQMSDLLQRACITGQEALVTLLTGYCTDINAISPNLGSALSCSCEFGYESIVDVLLCAGAKLSGPVELPQYQELDGADDSASPFQHCPFYVVSQRGWLNVLKTLIDHKPGLFSESSACQTLLQLACIGGHLNILEYCIYTLPTLVSQPQREILALYMQSEDLLEICLRAQHFALIPSLLDSGATFTERLIADYCDVVGQYLGQFVNELDQSSEGESNSEELASSSRELPAVLQCMDWSRKSLVVCPTSWLSCYLFNVNRIDLSYNPLTTLPSLLPWSFTRLRTLLVTHCQLTHLTPPPPQISTGVLATSLHTIDLSKNHLAHLPVELFQCPALESLKLSYNRIVYNASSENKDVEWACIKLSMIDMSNNRLESLPVRLRTCSYMSHINVSGNQLTTFLQPWTCPLKVLDLSRNSLPALPLDIDNFWSSSLANVSLSHNRLTEISQSLCRLVSLVDLNLSNNRLKTLPNPSWWQCKGLQTLDLSGNQLDTVKQNKQPPRSIQSVQNSIVDHFHRLASAAPSSPSHSPSRLGIESPHPDSGAAGRRVGGSGDRVHQAVEFPKLFAQSLLELNLAGNHLREVPPSICALSQLTKLDLSRNSYLHELPNTLCHLRQLETLMLDGLRLTDPLLKQCLMQRGPTRQVLAHLRQKLRRSVPYYRIKLLIVGSQAGGKTTLSHAIRGTASPSVNLSTDGVEITECKISSKQKKEPNLTVQIWDFAGQKDYYVTHKVFLSPCSLYLVTFDVRLLNEGADSLRVWLSDIQAHAAGAHVIIVCTYLDLLKEKDAVSKLRDYIFRIYNRGFPVINQVVAVSGVGKREGIDELKKIIYDVAFQIKVRAEFCQKVNIVGRQVPEDYLALAKAVEKEAEKRIADGKWPVLDEKEFWQLAISVPNSNIDTAEELQLAALFLHDMGHLLHFSSHLHGLSRLYFISPKWLAKTLANFFTIDSVHRLARGGIVQISDAQSLLFKGIASDKLEQYIDLLEAFDVALRLDENRLLLPSKLPMDRPGCQVPPTSKHLPPLRRLYRMTHVPSGFWSRVIVQVIGTLQREGSSKFGERDTMDTLGKRVRLSLMCNEPVITYWAEGVVVNYGNSLLMIESALPFFPLCTDNDQERPGSQIMEDFVLVRVPRVVKTREEKEEEGRSKQDGIFVTVFAPAIHGDEAMQCGLLAFAADLIDSLIEQWFSGLLEEDAMDVLIPCPSCIFSRRASNLLTNIHWYPLIECANLILGCDDPSKLSLSCPKCSATNVSLHQLVPDLLLSDVKAEFHVLWEEITVNKVTGLVGRGGEGNVYKGLLRGEQEVAIKQNMLINHPSRTINKKSARNSAASASGESGKGESIPVETGKFKSAPVEQSTVDSKMKTEEENTSKTLEASIIAMGVLPSVIRSVSGISENSMSKVDCDSMSTINKRTSGSTENSGSDEDRKQVEEPMLERSVAEGCDADKVSDTDKKSDSGRSTNLSESGVSTDLDEFWKNRVVGCFRAFRQETSALVSLKHPCIVSLLGICVPQLSYVMELCTLGSLRKVLDDAREKSVARDSIRKESLCDGGALECRLPLDKFLTYKIICQISSALAYLHLKRIVYKDMKPENLLVWSLSTSDSVNIKLSDYGLARKLTQQGLMGNEGTPGYLAPEIRQSKPYNEKVDIFALAMVLFELGTGRRGFAGQATVVVNKLLQDGKRPPFYQDRDDALAGFPPLSTLTRRCWSHDPAERPSANQIIAILRDSSFHTLAKVVRMSEQGIMGKVTAISLAPASARSRQWYIRMWSAVKDSAHNTTLGGKDSARSRCHVFNCNMGQFKVINQSEAAVNPVLKKDKSGMQKVQTLAGVESDVGEGASGTEGEEGAVSCMATIGGKFTVVGRTNGCLDALVSDRLTNKLKSVCSASCKSVPLCILPRHVTTTLNIKTSLRQNVMMSSQRHNVMKLTTQFYVGLNDSQFRVYDIVGLDQWGVCEEGGERGDVELGNVSIELKSSIYLADPMQGSSPVLCAVVVQSNSSTISPSTHSLNQLTARCDLEQSSSSTVNRATPLFDDVLWVGCGQCVVVVDCDALYLCLTRRKCVRVFPESLPEQMITALCCHQDQIWCLSSHAAIIVELDVESAEILCTFDCSEFSLINLVISDYDNKHLVIQSKTERQQEDSVSMSNNGASNASQSQLTAPHIRKSQHSMASISIRRKRLSHKSCRKRRGANIPLEGEAAEICPQKIPCRYLTSMCYVKDALWVGTSLGEVIVISVKSDTVTHGHVVAVLRDDVASASCDSTTSGSHDLMASSPHCVMTSEAAVRYLVNVSDQYVVAIFDGDEVRRSNSGGEKSATLRKRSHQMKFGGKGKIGSADKGDDPRSRDDPRLGGLWKEIGEHAGGRIVMWFAVNVEDLVAKQETWNDLE